MTEREHPASGGGESVSNGPAGGAGAAPRRIGPYEVLAELGRGGMATVFRVRDPASGAARALKLLRPIVGDAAARARFRREFRALQRVQHPNVLAVYDSGVEGDRPWYTMEEVEGVDAAAAADAWRELDPEERFARIQGVLVQVARALAFVHDRGLVHRDITPANIMIRTDGVAKLMDFGLVTGADAELTAAGEIVGTIAYAAPEQIRGEAVDGRADLYALGAVLYRMLTGRKPFAAHTLHGTMERQLNEVPRPPRGIDPLVPERLDALCQRLLEKDPRARFASANHLLHLLGDDASRFDDDRWPPRTVGRGAVRARLRSLVDDLEQARKGAAVLVTGEAGAGKSRMLDLSEAEARRRGITVARAHAVPHDRPFGLFAPVYRALSGGVAPAVLRAQFDGVGEPPTERYPVIAALRDLVAQRQPVLLVLDDLQHADAASRELIDYLVRNTLELADLAVGFALGAEAAEGSPAGVNGAAVARVHLGPLGQSEVEELVLSVVPPGPAAEALARRLYHETGGSPAFLADMLQALVKEGILDRDGERWRLTRAPDEISRSSLPLPASLRASLAARLGPLTPEARAVGGILAIAQRSLDLDTLLELVGVEEERALAAIDALIDAGVVREARVGDLETVELAHARFRDILTADVTPEDRRARHRRVGEVLERTHRHALRPVVEALAYHFEHAGVPPKALAYLAATAEKHLARGLYGEAVSFLDRALRLEPSARPLVPLDEADRRLTNLRLSRARASWNLGNWQEARADVDTAERIATEVRDQALLSEVLAEKGRILWNLAQRDEARKALEGAVEHAQASGRRTLLPRPTYHLGALAWSQGDLPRAHQLWKESLDVAREVGDARAEGTAYIGLGILAFCEGRINEAADHLSRSVDHFERLGMVTEVSIPRINLIELDLLMGRLKRAVTRCDQTLAQARELGQRQSIALGLVWHARLRRVLGRPEEARRSAVEALRIAESLGTVEDRVLALVTLVEALLALGMGAFAAARVETLTRLLATADNEGIGAQVRALQASVLHAQGDGAGARAILLALPEVPVGFPHIRVRTDLDVAAAWQRVGEPGRARHAFLRALDESRTYRFRYAQLLALHGLSQTEAAGEAREAAARSARSLARSLSASLARADADSFLGLGWGLDVLPGG